MVELPPYARLLRLSAAEIDGRLTFTMPFHDDVTGRPGFLHGGAIAALLEFAAFGTLRRELDRDGAAASAAMKPVTVTTDFLRGGRPKDTMATARIERLGRRIANVDAVAWQDARDVPIANARMTFLLER
ncbi:PaaI family thioesterase [Sphingomicrobium sp. XHP0235]|uniref:PaaI family thioesterase n=1 Tax=Sphingomicrobium aquimarinum TaxID=3133971 RepID=UPI0031FF1FFF